MVQQLAIPKTTMTYDEFRARATEEVRAEWVDGEVIELMPPDDRHQDLSMFLATLLNLFVVAKNLGKIFATPFEMRLRDGQSYREPDILFVSKANNDRRDGKRLNGPADMVIEIISDDSVARDRRDKFADYAAGGVREYWIVDPRPGKQELNCWLLADEGYYKPIEPDASGRIHSAVVDGFWLDPAWITVETLPYALNALAEIDSDLVRPIHVSTLD